MAIQRGYARYGVPVNLHDNLRSFIDEPIYSGIHAISYRAPTEHNLVEVMFLDRGAAATTVLFHAAVNYNEVTLPVFTGHQLTEHLETNLLYISDPCLDNTTNIGWFTGDRSRPLQRDLPRIIEHVHGDGPLVFFGSSAGGFAALYYSHFFPDSLAIVSNPQTDIGQFYKEHVQNYLATCWPGLTLGELPVTASVVELYHKSFPNYVAYIQNNDDEFHITRHLQPFLAATVNNADRRRVIRGDWGEGHTPADVPYLSAVIAWALETRGNWEEFFSDDEFSRD